MDQPRLFSTFMLWMLAQLYEGLPEVGDLPKPKLCFFFDEAHLLFDDASDALMDQIERTARLIRSKGVGVYFVTQVPGDVPSSVLAQLGNRVQHALRAFTPEDADALRKAARTFPTTEFYDVEKTLTSLGTGEALVTVLSPRGIPTPLAATRLLPPDSLMAPIDQATFQGIVAAQSASTRSTGRRSTVIARMSGSRLASPQRVRRRSRPPPVQGLDPTTAGGLNGMTPAQQQRELARQQREIEAAEKRAAREEERQRRAAAEAGRSRRKGASADDRYGDPDRRQGRQARGSGRTSSGASSGRCSGAAARGKRRMGDMTARGPRRARHLAVWCWLVALAVLGLCGPAQFDAIVATRRSLASPSPLADRPADDLALRRRRAGRVGLAIRVERPARLPVRLDHRAREPGLRRVVGARRPALPQRTDRPLRARRARERRGSSVTAELLRAVQRFDARRA